MGTDAQLVVAVTGATGTIGRGLLPLLEADGRVRHVIAVSSRPPSPDLEALPKVKHRRADVRDRRALEDALSGADVVVHLAFALYGVRQSEATLRAINVEGTRNTVHATAAVGARRLVYTSSGAVYGFDPGRPRRVAEDAPIDPEPQHFYSRQKVETERALRATLEQLPDLECVLFRPCAVVGPHALGAAAHAVPQAVASAAAAAAAVAGSAGLRPAIPPPPVPVQFVHESDVGEAIVRAACGPARPGVYNLGGEGMVDGDDVPRLLGLRRLPLPASVSRAAIAAVGRLPAVWPALGWLQLLRHPLELDTTRAREELGWAPRFSSSAALAATRRALAL